MIRITTAALTSEGGLGAFSNLAHDDAPHDSNRRNSTSQFKVMTLIPGFTQEADRLMDYLARFPIYNSMWFILKPMLWSQELGIFDALKKEYLKTFIFAIYLVSTSIFLYLIRLIPVCMP